MMRQSAENTSLATRNNSRSRFLGPVRNRCASTIPSLPVPSSCTCHDTNARVGTDTPDYRPPSAARTTLWAASRTFDLWIRRFPAGISVGDPVLKRGHSNTTAISLPADCGWLRGGEGGAALVRSMDCFVALGNGGHIVLGGRIAWPEFSDPGDSGGRSLWIASRCLGSVLHSGLASSCPCSWVLVGYDMGIHDRCSGNTAVWS